MIRPQLYFLFKYSGAHQHLHSFPTRRSSDLSSRAPASTLIGRLICAIPPLGPLTRSEEHTSELQSHSVLVCRLRPVQMNIYSVPQLVSTPLSVSVWLLFTATTALLCSVTVEA